MIRPDGSEVITVVGPDGQLMRRTGSDREGREISHHRQHLSVTHVPLAASLSTRRRRWSWASSTIATSSITTMRRPELVYDTLIAPPVQRIDRRYSLDEIRYSPNVRMLMPSIDLNTINFELGSWEIPPDQAAKLQAIADGLNQAIQRNPREVFLIEGHTDATGNDTDNLSLSDRRAESAAELLDAAIRGARGKPDLAGLRLAISERADRRTEPHQPARHRPPHHAAARHRQQRFVAAAAARHRAAAGEVNRVNAKWPGAIPAILFLRSTLHESRPRLVRNCARERGPITTGSYCCGTQKVPACFSTLACGYGSRIALANPPVCRRTRPYFFSPSSFGMYEPLPIDSKPVFA